MTKRQLKIMIREEIRKINESNPMEILKRNISKQIRKSDFEINIGGGFTNIKTDDGNFIVVVEIGKPKKIKDPSKDVSDVKEFKVEKYMIVKASKDGKLLKILDTVKNINQVKPKKFINESISKEDEMKIKGAIKDNNNRFFGLEEKLKKLGYKDVKTTVLDMLPPIIDFKIGNKKCRIVNKKYLQNKSDADFIVGELAVGML